MFRSRFLCLVLAIVCVLSVGSAVCAAEVDCDSVYCFTSEDFAGEEPLRGICITDLPDAQTGTVLLGSRVICAGDILHADQLTQLTFSPLLTKKDTDAVVTYLPIYENRVAKPVTAVISVHGKEDKAPVAEDSTLETYRNMPNKGILQASDPEGAALTFSVCRQPKRGSVTVADDGTFVYTPKKNKVGVDSFTYTAADPAGNVSRKATVTVQVLKSASAKQYTDTVGTDCRFTAEWMRNSGIFVGEKIGDAACFYPNKTVSRGEFLTMVVKALELPTDKAAQTALPENTPDWLKPYVAAAMRAGLTAGLPAQESGETDYDAPISGAEAAVMLQNVLDLTVSQEKLEAMQTAQSEDSDIPTWASVSLTAMEGNGIPVSAGDAVTRADASRILYGAAHLAPNAPGLLALKTKK